MKNILTLLTTLFALTSINQTQAQIYTLNWGSSFASPWAAGSSTSHTTTTFGTSGITATVSFSGPETGAMSAFSGFTSPQVSSGGSPFTTQLGSNVSNLALGMNLTSSTDYVDITITFSGPVSNVVFNVADIDKSANNSNTYYDEIVVTGLNVATPVTNPVLTKLNGTLPNAITDTAIISGNTAYSNTTNGKGGNTPSNTTDQNGTVQVNFGIVPLTSINIRYQNFTGVQTNPADQAIGIGNISFQKLSILPVVLTSFIAAEKDGRNELNWTTSQEVNLSEFVVEKSNDGENWQNIATVTATGNSSVPVTYHSEDAQPFTVTYYRLKQINMDGTYVYSTVLRMAKENNNYSIKVFPNPVTSSATITTNSKENKTIHIKIFSNNGALINQLTRQITIGTNNIDIPSVSSLANGVYTVSIDDSGNNQQGITRFVKQ